MSWDDGVASEARQQDDVRDEIARIVDPFAWMQRERALDPYREGRGSRGAENPIYQVTWSKGFRSPEEVDDWLRNGTPQPDECSYILHVALQRSISQADAVLAMLRTRNLID